MCNHTAAHSVLEAWVEDKEELGLLVPGIRSDRVSKVMGASCWKHVAKIHCKNTYGVGMNVVAFWGSWAQEVSPIEVS
jgi:hypothetical protein